MTRGPAPSGTTAGELPTRSALERRLAEIPRTALGVTPTPLTPAPRLAAALGLQEDRLFLKMDAFTGFGLGGNKVRKIEYELAPDRLAGVRWLVTAGGHQSNHARVTAAAAAYLGLRCLLVLNGEAPDPPTGNALLHRLLGAEIRTVPAREDRDAAMTDAARELDRAGEPALVVPLGASTPRGALGYVGAALELDRQAEALPATPGEGTWIFVPSSSCGTLAGLALGMAALGRDRVRLVGVSADADATELRTATEALTAGAARILGIPGSLPAGLLELSDEEVGPGYGLPTRASHEATLLFARSAGVILDPVYTSKAAAGMVRWIRDGRIPEGDRVIFWHTGGHPALFA